MKLFNSPWRGFVELRQMQAEKAARDLTEQDFEQKTVEGLAESIHSQLVQSLRIGKNGRKRKGTSVMDALPLMFGYHFRATEIFSRLKSEAIFNVRSTQ